MKVSVVLAHPDEKSFNHAIAAVVIKALKEKNHEIIFHDLYKEQFNPLLPTGEIRPNGKIEGEVEKYCNELVSSEGVIVIHPNWWEQPPAILKGWVDRVFRPGLAYRFNEEGKPVGLLKIKTAVVINTSNTPEEPEMKFYGDPLENLWGRCTFKFCGVENFYRKMYKEVIRSTDEQRKTWLEDVKMIINQHFE